MTFQEAKEWLEADGYVVTKREAVDRIADALERLLAKVEEECKVGGCLWRLGRKA
jgi:hypothetical protein